MLCVLFDDIGDPLTRAVMVYQKGHSKIHYAWG